jgi:hypothetical protein
VEAGADLQTNALHGTDCLERAFGRCSRGVEDGEKAVARRVLLAPTVAPQGVANQAVMLLDELAPRSITKLGGDLCGADDIGKEDGRQEALGLTPRHGRSLTARSSDDKMSGKPAANAGTVDNRSVIMPGNE